MDTLFALLSFFPLVRDGGCRLLYEFRESLLENCDEMLCEEDVE